MLLLWILGVIMAAMAMADDTGWSSLGCYTDSVSYRTLTQSIQTGFSNNVTVDNCLVACESNGYEYCGVENGDECWGDMSIMNGGHSAKAGCTMMCKGDDSQICGGENRLNLYQEKDETHASTSNILSIPPKTTTEPSKTPGTTTSSTKPAYSATYSDLSSAEVTEASTTVKGTIPMTTFLTVTTQLSSASSGVVTGLPKSTSPIVSTTAFAQPAASSPPSSSPSNPLIPQKRNSIALEIIIPIVVVGCVFIGLAILFLYLKGRSKRDDEKTGSGDYSDQSYVTAGRIAIGFPQWAGENYMGDEADAVERYPTPEPGPTTPPSSPTVSESPSPPLPPTPPPAPTPPHPSTPSPPSTRPLSPSPPPPPPPSSTGPPPRARRNTPPPRPARPEEPLFERLSGVPAGYYPPEGSSNFIRSMRGLPIPESPPPPPRRLVPVMRPIYRHDDSEFDTLERARVPAPEALSPELRQHLGGENGSTPQQRAQAASPYFRTEEGDSLVSESVYPTNGSSYRWGLAQYWVYE